MYDWLSDALEDSSEVVTANRRLARVLAAQYAREQAASGQKAWKTPAIASLQDWLVQRTDASGSKRELPVRLNGHQSRILWERCLTDNLQAIQWQSNSLVRQAQDAWSRLSRYQVPPDALNESVRNHDQRVFANAAADYRKLLSEAGWVDSESLATLVSGLLRDRNVTSAGRITFAGFDRLTPAQIELQTALASQDVDVVDVDAGQAAARTCLAEFETSDAEMRAAGAWARQELLDDPSRRLGIVAVHLDRDAVRLARLVREGLAPGWQTGGWEYDAALNVSLGQALSEYPAIATAITILGWLCDDLSSAKLSRLLRSATVGQGDVSQRAELELAIRDLPSMQWAPERFARAFANHAGMHREFLNRVETLGKRRAQMPARGSPAQWAVIFDDVLDAMNWPGEEALGSEDFQLVNRWRELLNDLARLELVVRSMTLGEALSRIRTLAAETVYQPESLENSVQLMGPLEAAGMEFDALWIAGLSSANWPPQGNVSALLSRDLQRAFEMPDFDPAETLSYATRVLRRLAASAASVVFSYPRMDGDAEQSPSGLLRLFPERSSEVPVDPGWYARTVANNAAIRTVASDPVPPVRPPETVTGGTATVQHQRNDPFSAFAFGRLGIRPIPRLAYGLPASLRGRMLHSALADLYSDVDSRDSLQQRAAEGLGPRVQDIARRSAAWLDSRADTTVRQLLELERQRIVDLLHAVIELDLSRPPFEIVGLEAPVTLVSGAIEMSLRADRLDRDASGLLILDYKTGRYRKFLRSDGEPEDIQLVVYSCAIEEPISGLALVNVDSRRVDINGAGRELTPDVDWDAALERWRNETLTTLDALQRGDARLNSALATKDLRRLGLLSRVQELKRAG